MRRGVYRGWVGEEELVVDEEEEDIFLGFDVSQFCSDTIKELQYAETDFAVFPVCCIRSIVLYLYSRVYKIRITITIQI